MTHIGCASVSFFLSWESCTSRSMPRPLRIALFIARFPVVSETFILRQVASLLNLGHEVDVYSDSGGEAGGPAHPEVARYRLLERTTYMYMPPETFPYEMPVW